MGQFLVRRLFWSSLTLVVISMITFWILVVMPPGNPAQRFAGKQPTDEKIAQIERDYCLDKNRVTTYGCFMKMTLSGHFISPSTNSNVIPPALHAIPVTLSLAVFAALIWLTMGVSFGIKGALAPGSLLDRSLMIGALIGISFPMAWLSLLSLKTFSDSPFRFFPAGGYESIAEGGIFAWAWHILLPAATLSVVFAGVYARLTRTSVREALRNEYVKTAVSKGLPSRQVFVHHVLRTGLIPIIVMFGIDFAALLGGAIFTETVFGLPGLGGFLMQGIATFDLAVLFVGTLIAASFVVVSTTIVDLVQAAVDPRVRLA